MKKRGIALIGFRTTGKSLTGSILAEQLAHVFVDMDDMLVASFGKDIDSWVGSHGWESFRKAESELLETLSKRENLVVATGGGVVLYERNRRTLRESFHVIWLRAAPETIYSRLISDPKTPANRPALTDLPLREEIERLLRDRSPLYAEAADLILETDKSSAEEVALQIREQLTEQRKAEIK
jgi:shikimate kinase